MTPIYMPFTHISAETAWALALVFEEVTLYQTWAQKPVHTISRWIEKGFIAPRIPVKGADAKIDTVIQRYHTWAESNSHMGGFDTAFLKTRLETIPFFDDTATSQIRSDIQKGPDARKDLSGNYLPRDPLFEALVFLRMAEEYDAKNEEIDTDLSYHDALEKDLMRQLHGEKDVSQQVPSQSRQKPPTDPGSVMTAERIRCWLKLYASDKHGYDLFVTDSPSVVEFLEGDTGDLMIVPGFEGLSLGPFMTDDRRAGLRKAMADIIRAKDPLQARSLDMGHFDDGSQANKEAALSLMVLPGVAPGVFFRRFAGGKILDSIGNRPDMTPPNTLIALITR
jgi:hypothetical protein